MRKKITVSLFFCILLIGIVFADFNADENIQMGGNDVYNATNINGTNIYQEGNLVVDTSSIVNLSSNYSSFSNSSTFWSGVSSFVSRWFYASANVLNFNETLMNESIDDKVTKANSSMKTYVDAQDVSFNTSMKSYVNAQDILFNDSMVAHVSTVNSSMTSYVDSQDIIVNTSMKGYVDIQDTSANTSIKNYCDATFVTSAAGTNITDFFNISSTFSDANSTWEHQSYPSTCSASFGVSEVGDSNVCTHFMLGTGDTVTGDYNIIGNLNVISEARLDRQRWDRPISDAGLLAYYPFTTGTAEDWSGEGNDGTLNGGAVINYDSCKMGQCAYFDGINDFVQTGLNIFSNFTFINGSTISAWSRRIETNPTGQKIFDSEARLTLEFTGSNYLCKSSNGSLTALTVSDSTSTRNIFQHVTCVWNGTHQYMFVDGEIQSDIDAFTGTIDFDSVSRNTAMGSRYDGITSFFNGSIDQVSIWNRSLSADEIKALYSQSSEFYAGKAFPILKGGKLGIGTTSPNSKLDVQGGLIVNQTSGAVAALFGVGTNDNVEVWILSGSTATRESKLIFAKGLSIMWRYQTVGSTSDLIWKNASNVEVMRLEQGGNLGLGITNPARRLHVNATIRYEPLATAPTSPSLGDTYTDTSNAFCWYNSTAWNRIAGSGSCS